MSENTTQSLTNALGIDGGVVCAVGAGGKKSLLYALAGEAAGRVGVTSTVMVLRFPRKLRARMVIDEDAVLRRSLAQPGSDALIAYAQPSDKRGRLAGVAPGTVDTIHAGGGFDLTLVKADGARMRGIKAPKTGEPVLPETADLITPVASAGVIGQPLNEDVAHRPERVAAVAGMASQETLTTAHVARLLVSEDGALQGTQGQRVVPVINQVDDDERLDQARECARQALAQTDRFDRVVLTCLRRDNPVVAVIELGQ